MAKLRQKQIPRSVEYPDTFDPFKTVGMPQIVTENVDGRIVQSVKFVETPVEKMNEGLTVNDFAIEVLLANGYEKHRIVDANHVSLSDIDKIVEQSNPV